VKPVRVKVNDKMQKGYVYWRTKPMGRDFRLGFNPDLTPKQMLALGLAEKRLDLSGRSAWLVPMVLPLLFGTTLSG
jgi:hypothetical protein